MDQSKAYSLPWFRVDVAMVDHPRVDALAEALGDPLAGWYVVRLWSWVMRYAARGRLADGARSSVERACAWRGEPGKLVQALVSTGWLDACADGGLEVHDWAEHQGAAVAKAEKDSERKRAARGRRAVGAEKSERTARAKTRTGERTARVTIRDVTRRDETTNSVAGETPAADGDAWKRLVADVAAVAPAYAFTGRDFKALKACLTLAKGTAAEVVTRWRRALAADGYPKVRTLAELERTWNHWATAGAANTRSPVAAESVDWDNAQEGEIAL